MNLNLHDKHVLVSASSGGIGYSIAKQFLEEGAFVTINGRRKDTLERVLSEFGKKYGNDKVVAIPGDVSNESIQEVVVQEHQKKFGTLDILVCNLGTGKPIGDNRYAIDEWEHMMKYNLLSGIGLVNKAVDILKKSNNGNIIFISSIASISKIDAPIAYASAKAGINTLVKYLSDDLARYGIRVNGVAPGNVFYKGGRWDELLSEDEYGVKKYIEDNVPMKRFATPDEIANVVVFLTSEKASFITGEIVRVDGGQSRGI